MGLCAILLLGAVLVFNVGVQGYVYDGEISTEDGFCNLEKEGFGKVAVGEKGYNDEACEKVHCRTGSYAVTGCGKAIYDEEKCREVRGSGHYPNCCPEVVCDIKSKH